jgi:hypothetical protein
VRKDIERRIKKLETKLRRENITLFFDDGSTTELRDHRGTLLLRMFYAATSIAELSAEEAKLLDLISRATAAWEPGNSHMFDLVKCALNAGAKEMNRMLEASRIGTLEATEAAGVTASEAKAQPKV